MNTHPISAVASLPLRSLALMGIALAACRVDSTEPSSGRGPVPVPAFMVTDDPPGQSTWSTPVNLGAGINSVANDQGPVISKDELTLYFASTRKGGFGGNDL